MIVRFWFWKRVSDSVDNSCQKWCMNHQNPTKNWTNRSQLLFHTLKTMLIQLQWSDFKFEETFEIVRQFLLKWCTICYNLPKNKGTAMFFVYSFECTEWSTQTQRSLYFLTDFNNSRTKIVSQFWFFIQNWIPTTAARLALFLKYEVINGSCSINFCWISTICTSFWQELSHESEHVFEIEFGLS